MPKHIYINDFQPNQLIEGLYAIQNGQLAMTKSGKPYLKCLLADRTGRTPGRMWNAPEDLFSTVPQDGFVYVEGQTQPYQGEMQVIIQNLAPAQPSGRDLEDLLPRTRFDVEQMFSDVEQVMRSLKSPQLQALCKVYFDDKTLMERFRQAPAAQTLHHAFIGGLLEHTRALLKLAEVVLPLYPKVNREIVLMGLFLHDLGKCVELTWMNGFDYSDEGRLVGHIARGVVWLNEKARIAGTAGTPISSEMLHTLEHIILSHHGEPEFGALKPPSTPEAILIHMLDNIDAKMQMALDAVRGEQAGAQLGGNFTDKVWALGNTRMYRVDPVVNENAKPVPMPELKLGA